MKNENEYILAISSILERMAADGYTFDDVEDVFYTSVDETGLFEEIDETDLGFGDIYDDDYEDS